MLRIVLTALIFAMIPLIGTLHLNEDTWCAFADWVLSEEESFDPHLVQAGDTIVIRDRNDLLFESLNRFEKEYLPSIQYPIILITPRTDFSLPGKRDSLLQSEKIAAWFVQNIDREQTDTLFALPIGVTAPSCGVNLQILDFYIEKNPPIRRKKKKNLVYINLSLTHSERIKAIRYFREYFPQIPLYTRTSFERYIRDVLNSTFVLSPPGNGLDCHRTWEALLLGRYPIVKHSTLDPLFEGMPVLLVNDWSDITPEVLQQKKEVFDTMEWSRERLYAPYWFDKIRHIQHTIRENYPH